MALITNHKAGLNYEFLERYEAGIELLGLEVKSLRKKQGSLEGSYVKFLGNEAYLVNADIPPYQSENVSTTYDRLRQRKLLLSKKEILSLTQKTSKEGLTLIPISLYNGGTKLKVELALSRGKRKFDKRESIRKRESDREIERVIKRGK